MAIPIYLWLYDSSGHMIKGSVDVFGREGSIEVQEFMSGVEIPCDGLSGQVTGTRIHTGIAFEKETDAASIWLYRALTMGEIIPRAVFLFFHINDSGQEEEYFRVSLENVRIDEIDTFFTGPGSTPRIKRNHQEYIGLVYEKITWHYLDGNLMHSDSWNKRETA
jgi:type VI secretion system secreted protein Hcp